MKSATFNTHLINYIANTCISTSTLRKQGAPNVIKITRTYLKQIDLKSFFKSLKSENSYEAFLNGHTNKLKNKYTGKAKGNFGAARKGLNIFFRNIMYHLNLIDNKKSFRHFEDLNEKLQYLEIPLDKYTSKKLQENTKLKWPGIRNLDLKTSDLFQAQAYLKAKEINIARVNLDIIYWRDGE